MQDLQQDLLNGIYYKKVWDLSIIREIYKNIQVMKNEENTFELGFISVDIAEKNNFY